MINHIGKAKILTKLHQKLKLNKLKFTKKSCFRENILYFISSTMKNTKMLDFVNILTIFI